METTVEVIGVHPVVAEEPVHLIEVVVRNSAGPFELVAFWQENPTQPKSNWQVCYDEQVLDKTGERIVADGWDAKKDKGLWTGDVRLAFFLHYVDFSKPLNTQFGDVPLPSPTERPARLSMINYDSPC
jgi:hypothetical protein